ncbi:hypothetical protein O181_032490 [Austropuccinia psidii MF-1]|uniref:Integrase catalytic domain-containing protein n=1 Tax=Austropuccinia psidii MF-1 TaxID=1389203 RepID=A0A9Q3H898_9BASI|nr:hypothetical protein [Austropuccinia psidii MF-1]
MRFLLRSRELLDVCENPIGQDATPASRDRWNKLSFEAINLITSRINQQAFLEVVRPETSDKADLLWTCINKHYASKRNLNKGRVWMNWKKLNYTGNLQVYIDNTQKFLLDLQSVSVELPPEILSYIILGKLGNNASLTQVVEMLTLNDNILKKPDQVLLRLQEYDNLQTAKVVTKDPSPVSALISSSEHKFKITHFCSNGLHNPKCMTHRKDQCYGENPHLRPPRQNNKKKAQGTPPLAHALVTLMVISQGHPNKVVIDCGATHHMFHSKEVFTSLVNTPNLFISTGDSMSQLRAEGMGTVSIIVDQRPLNLVDCLYVPKLNCNLISLLQLFHGQVTITKNLDTFDLKTNEDILFHQKIINNLMKVDFTWPTLLSTTIVDDLWHKRLGHPGRGPVHAMGLPSLNVPCHTCELNKIHQLPFKDQFEHISHPLHFVHIDLVGPISPPSIAGSLYFLTIVDQFTSFKLTRMMKHKSEAFDCFIVSKKLMETQHNRRIKKLILDRGGEFLNDWFKHLASSCGFTHTFSPPYTPKHNGFAERANCTLLDKAKCLLNGSGLPKCFWAEAVNTATLLCNLIPTPLRHNNSPYVLWTGKSPRIKKLCIFGCQAVVLIQRNLREWKLGESRCQGIFLGYENDMSAYCVMRLSDGKIVISKHVLFDKSVYPNSPVHLSSASPLVIPLVRSEEGSDNSKSCSGEPVDNLGSQEAVDEARQPEDDPSSLDQDEEGVDEVLSCLPTDAATEPQPIVQSRLRVIGPRHPMLISSKILPYSRRAAAFLSSVEVVPWTFKMAVSSASKDVWLAAISKELKSMDDLKQPPLAWYKHLRGWLVKVNFSPCVLDPWVFYWSAESPVWLDIHVANIAIIGKDIESFKAEISREFEIKNIGKADLMLGVKLTHNEDFIALNQKHFSESLLELYGMSDCHPVATPLAPNHHLSSESEEELSLLNSLGISYRSAIGSINYLSTATRPDISYAVSSLLQFLEQPGINHWKAFLHFLQYLKGTQDLALTYRWDNNSGIVAYSDADWGNCPDTQRSVTGFLATFDGCLVMWKTRKQPTVLLSTSKAEYKSLCDVTSELLCMRQWCEEAALFNSGPQR